MAEEGTDGAAVVVVLAGCSVVRGCAVGRVGSGGTDVVVGVVVVVVDVVVVEEVVVVLLVVDDDGATATEESSPATVPAGAAASAVRTRSASPLAVTPSAVAATTAAASTPTRTTATRERGERTIVRVVRHRSLASCRHLRFVIVPPHGETHEVTSDDPLATFTRMMELEPHGADTFVGVGPRYPWGGLYGGQIVAQSLRAAGLTVEPAFRPHSLHAYFIRPGDHTEPIRFEVDRIRNGRSFATRRVVARQSIGAIFNLAASFHVVEDAVDVQSATMDPSIAGPDAYPGDSWSHVFERRQISPRAAWFRMAEPVGDDPLTQACALAYVSDDLPTEAVVADHPARAGITTEDDFDRRFMSASLDHVIWFHRPIDVGVWHLHHLRSRGLTGSRGLATGEVFTADGVHAATITQEVLLRERR